MVHSSLFDFNQFIKFSKQTRTSGRIRYFHTNTMTPPTIIPASAPFRLERFQKSANSITGPKPIHAKETMLNTELSGSLAMITPITEMATTVSRATCMGAAHKAQYSKKAQQRKLLGLPLCCGQLTVFSRRGSIKFMKLSGKVITVAVTTFQCDFGNGIRLGQQKMTRILHTE